MNFKNQIYKFLFHLGRIVGVIDTPINNISKMLVSFYYRIYTGFHSRKFKHFGANSLLVSANFLTGLQYVSVGDNVVLGKGIRLTAWYCGVKPHIHIGNGTRFGENAHITCINSITIGNNVLTGRNVLISDNSHGQSAEMLLEIPPIDRILYSKGAVKIGNNVWVGENVCILPGVEIGDNCIIGANTVVSKSVPKNSIVVGGGMRVINIG